jgi:hypothetical protein
MTKEQFDAIRLEYISDPCHHPIPALLDEVERLTQREDVLVKAGLDLMVANKDLTAERDAAFKRGASKMREAAAQACEVSPIHGQKTTTARRYADAVRALPIPEDKS